MTSYPLKIKSQSSARHRTLHVLDPNRLSSTVFSRNTALPGVTGTDSFPTAVPLHTGSLCLAGPDGHGACPSPPRPPAPLASLGFSQSLEHVCHRVSQTERKCSFLTSCLPESRARAGPSPQHLTGSLASGKISMTIC